MTNNLKFSFFAYMDKVEILYSLSNFRISDWKKGKKILINKQEYERICLYLEKYNINYFFREGFMPSIFDNIKPKPFLIYFLGDKSIFEREYRFISIVGPRHPSRYAIVIIENLLEMLSQYKNVVTISGMATGIDSMVHNLSIKYKIPTIAVLGGGLGRYIENYKDKIFRIIKGGGVVISEFKLFQMPEKYTFPQRNRIIAGLGEWLFVPEAGEGSGSLITVDYGLKFRKSIYGCPNNIFKIEAKGINKYIANGKIKLVYDIGLFVRDILGDVEKIKHDYFENLDEVDKKIISAIKNGMNTVDSISNFVSNLTTSQLLGKLTLLEIKGVVNQISPGFYKLK